MWQPIETAPRDATAILVMRDIWPGARSGRAEECNGRNTYVAAWWPDERGGQGAWICYMDAVLDPECPVEPTHWMPLPDAPGAQPAPSVPECPYPCGWQRLLKYAMEDGAYLARSINEDEPVTDKERAVTMRVVLQLRAVLLAIINAALEAKP